MLSQKTGRVILPVVVLCFLCFAVSSWGQVVEQRANSVALSRALGTTPMVFETNKGQVPQDVKFVTRNGASAVLFRESGPTFLAAGDVNLGLRFAAKKVNAIEGLQPLKATVSYFLGSDPSTWVRQIPSVGAIIYRDVYPGVDARFAVQDGQLQLRMEAQAASDATRVRLNLHGARILRIDPSGDLVAEAGRGGFRFGKPSAYQVVSGVRMEVEAAYTLRDSTFAFLLGACRNEK